MKKNPVVHFEMPYKDSARVSKFYSDVFGWGMNDAGENMGHYLVAATSETDENNMVKTPGTINGGFFNYDEKIPGRTIPSVVVSVENIEESMKMVEQAGGKVEGKPQDIPGIGMWIVFIDSEGNRVGMLQPS